MLGSGKFALRAGDAFVSKQPLDPSQVRRLVRSRLRLPRGMEMIGGLDGREPTLGDMRRLAELLEKDWNLRHHVHRTYEQHLADVQLRFDTISAPTFVAYGPGGWPDTAFFPIRTTSTPANEDGITSAAYWNTDFGNGVVLAMRKSVSDREFSLDLERKLLTGAVIPYACLLANIGEIRSMLFYTWHLNGTFQSEQHRQERAMHLELGAIPSLTFMGGRIEEMVYTHLLY
jgi:hypothetical protein